MSSADARRVPWAGDAVVKDVAAKGPDCGLASGVPAGRRSRTPSAEVESELIAAAEVVLVRDGPGGLIVRAVAAAAGVSQMSVYNRFGGKDGLINALLIIGFERLRAVIETAISGPPAAAGTASGTKTDMLARLRDCALRYRDFALANPHFYAIMFEDAIPHEDSPEVWGRVSEVIDSLVRLVEMTAIAGQIMAPDPTEVAQWIWSSVHGAVALEVRGIVLTSDPSATYEAMLETIFCGLAPKDTQGERRPPESV